MFALKVPSFVGPAARSLQLFAVCGVLTPLVSARQEPSSGGTLPVQVVGGHLVVSCDLSTAANRIPVNLFVEFEGSHGLQLHNRAADGLRAESSDGKSAPITIHFPSFAITVPRRELGDEDLFEDFTKYHSQEIGENALVGSIGAEVLAQWAVTFDLAQGQLRLAPLHATGQAPPGSVVTRDDGSIEFPITLINQRVWLPVRRADGTPGAMMVSTGQYDSLVDRAWAEALGKPGGDVGSVRLGPVDFHEYVALRPEPLVEVHPDGVVGKLGLNLLEHLELTIDRANRVATLKVTAPAQFPEGDRVFFRARALEDADIVEAFLDAYRDSRLAQEASKLLLNMRIDEDADQPKIARAVGWVAESTVKDLRTSRMLDLMREMADAGHTEVLLAAGALGVKAGRDDRYPNAVHGVHALLGRTYLKDYETTGEHSSEAWRHLLSAAFGLPEDGLINLDLGRFYERQGRFNRAFSRYLQAVIQPASGPQALEALQRVQPRLQSGGAFSVDTIERMIAGKVRNFGAATRYEPSAKEPAHRVVLVEFLTNGHQGDEKAGAIGGALGAEGLMQHFAPENVVFLSYHMKVPKVDPLCSELATSRARQLGIEEPGVFVIDGVSGAPGAGRWRDAEAIYQKVREAVVARLQEFSEFEFQVQAKLERKDGAWQLSGTADVLGYEENGLQIQAVLVEAGVLAPGASTVVVHRAVARAALTGSDEGIPFEFNQGSEDSMQLAWEVSLADVAANQQAYLDRLQSQGAGSTMRISSSIDPHQVRVVVYVFQSETKEILGSVQVTPQVIPEVQ